jgi:hypothetical protein
MEADVVIALTGISSAEILFVVAVAAWLAFDVLHERRRRQRRGSS